MQSCKPSNCPRCGEKLLKNDAETVSHQVGEPPEIKRHVSVYQRHRLGMFLRGQSLPDRRLEISSTSASCSKQWPHAYHSVLTGSGKERVKKRSRRSAAISFVVTPVAVIPCRMVLGMLSETHINLQCLSDALCTYLRDDYRIICSVPRNVRAVSQI